MSEKTGHQRIRRQRWELLLRIERWLDGPMAVLGFLWLALLILELTRGLTPLLQRLGTIIWVIFLLDFLGRLLLSPQKTLYLRKNWLTAVAVLLPALRVVRVVQIIRAARVARGLRLLRLLTSVNRGMGSLGRTMSRRGLGYVLALAATVWVVGAAGLTAFERGASGSVYADFGEALWWTAMLLTSVGPGQWPHTPEARILTLFISLFSMGVLGYLTAALASFFLGQDAEAREALPARKEKGKRLEEEIRHLEAAVTALRRELERRSDEREDRRIR